MKSDNIPILILMDSFTVRNILNETSVSDTIIAMKCFYEQVSKYISIEYCRILLRWHFILEEKAPHRDMERILMD